METIAAYLFRSSVWLTGFGLVYLLFLRNERFFALNRFYLILGMVLSLVFPFLTWHYTVIIPVLPSVGELNATPVAAVITDDPFSYKDFLWMLYFAGILVLLGRTLVQIISVGREILRSGSQSDESIKIIQTNRYSASFSFFNFVFVNPSIAEDEMREIIHHEREHIGQKHWIDLMLFELICLVQWFNPVVWLYGRMIRQNHEYLADERALQRSQNPAVYRAALLNQMFGGPVIPLANSFNYSLNKKRFNMMKQTIKSPVRKLKLLLVLPLIAGVFYAFAAPRYEFAEGAAKNNQEIISDEGIDAPKLISEATENQEKESLIKGKVVDEKGEALPGATVIISGTTEGTVTDVDGNFALKTDRKNPLVISFVGYKTEKIDPDFNTPMVVKMARAVVEIDVIEKTPDSVTSGKLDQALILVDDKEVTADELSQIKPETIDRIEVLKDGEFLKKYEEKGKNGVILVASKQVTSDVEKGSTTNLTGNFIAIQNSSKTSASTGLNFTAKTVQGDYKNGVTNIKADTIVIDAASSPSMFVVDGKESTKAVIDRLDSKKIESVNVIKGEPAIAKYGEKGKNGVVEIKTKKSSDDFVIVEEMPSFPGGIAALKAFVASNLQYPKSAVDAGIMGRVTVSFVVLKSGEIGDAKILNKVDPALDKEALRLVNSMPKWSPGKQAGKAVDVSYNLPIDFNLPKDRPIKDKLK